MNKKSTKSRMNLVNKLDSAFDKFKKAYEHKSLNKELSKLPAYIREDIGMDEESRKKQRELLLKKSI